jgi:uncharacterized protein YbaR (Trm112 family)
MKIFLITILFLIANQFAFAETLIYCPECKNALYIVTKDIKKGEQIKASDFVPVNDNVPCPKSNTKMVCPLCNSSLNAWVNYMENQGFKSYSMAFNAVSLLTKDKDGKWIYFPFDSPDKTNEVQ